MTSLKGLLADSIIFIEEDNNNENINGILASDAESGSDIPPPNMEFPARLPLDITFSAVLFIFVIVNIYTIVKLRVFENNNSLAIMVCLSVIEIIRILLLIWRVVENEYVKDIGSWFWYRVTTDITNYLLSIISLILLA